MEKILQQILEKVSSLQEGQNRILVRLDNLEEGQSAILVRLDNLEEGQHKLETKQDIMQSPPISRSNISPYFKRRALSQ